MHIIIGILIHSPFCALNCTLSAHRPNYVTAVCSTKKRWAGPLCEIFKPHHERSPFPFCRTEVILTHLSINKLTFEVWKASMHSSLKQWHSGSSVGTAVSYAYMTWDS